MAASPALLFWDIDKTLITGGGAGERAIERTMAEVFGKPIDLASVDYHGRTDRLIGEMVLQHVGLEPTRESIDRFVAGYLGRLPGEMPRGDARVLPGVGAILDHLAEREDEAQIALLTGNLREGARIKLSFLGLWERFPTGGFADHSPYRNEIAPAALREATSHYRREYEPARVFVIGDTIHDIACGKVIGARTIGVATGSYSTQALAAAGADHVFADFSETGPFLDLIG